MIKKLASIWVVFVVVFYMLILGYAFASLLIDLSNERRFIAVCFFMFIAITSAAISYLNQPPQN